MPDRFFRYTADIVLIFVRRACSIEALAAIDTLKTMLTSKLPFSKWEAIFKDPMTTAAAIDRLVHHSVLELNLTSYRLEEAKKSTTTEEGDN